MGSDGWLGGAERGGEGGGGGAGGFCASEIGARSTLKNASPTEMNMWWLIVRCLGRKLPRTKSVGRISAQVKAHTLNHATGWRLLHSLARWRMNPSLGPVQEASGNAIM